MTEGNYCDLAAPIWWENYDELERTPINITRQIVFNNELYAINCK